MSAATRWATLRPRPRVIPTYMDEVVVCSPRATCPSPVVSPWAPYTDTAVVDVAGSDQMVADGTVQRRGLLASVSHKQHPVAEPVDHVWAGDGARAGPPNCKVERAAATDRGQLMLIPDQRDSRAGLLRVGQQGSSSVLVEHPGLVDQEQVTAGQLGLGNRQAADSRPAAVVVPAEPVLMD